MASNKDNPSVVIIGAGMTGLLLVSKLREMGITNITVLEAKDRVGGTWRANTYPGVACDIPSFAYTYSFELNPDWSHLFARGDEIYRYFNNVFEKYDMARITHFNTAVTACHFDSNGQWQVTTKNGNTYAADLLFSATGILREPAKPKFPGMENFRGAIFHTAEWDHSVTLENKRIGVIGTGSTAAQAIPELINLHGVDVTVFQRTAQWMIEVPDREFTAADKARARRYPRLLKLQRDLTLWFFGQMTQAITSDHWFDKLKHRSLAKRSREYLNRTVKDPVLRQKLTPNYVFGCKRMIINATFYPAIQKPNAHLVIEAIDHFVENGIVTQDGKLHELDVVVLSTGFNPMAFMRPMAFTGRNGVSIDDVWKKKIQAYRSILLPGFPNFFLMLGPNTPIGNYSVIAMSEVQMQYITQLINAWRKGALATIEATPDATARWNTLLKSRMGKTVWTSGCNSWYLDADGDPMSWPDSWSKWVKVMAKPDLSDFVAD